MPETGGSRLKQAIHVARAKAGITSDVQLALRAGVSYDTLMNWYGGKTVPRGHELEKVAKATGSSLWALQAAYEGRPPEPPPIQDAVSDLVSVVGQLLGEIRAERSEWAMEREAREATGAAIAEALQELAREVARRDDPAPVLRGGVPNP